MDFTSVFPFNSAQTYVYLSFLDEIFVGHSVPEGNGVTPSAKSPKGKLGQWPRLASDSVKRPYKHVHAKK